MLTYVNIALLGLLGLSFLYFCFKFVRQIYIFKNTPQSKIRSAAQGVVEITGTLSPSQAGSIVSAIDSTPCLWWYYQTEKSQSVFFKRIILPLIGRRKDVVFNLLAGRSKRDSSKAPFVLSDDTGCCIVDSRNMYVDTKGVEQIQDESSFGALNSSVDKKNLLSTLAALYVLVPFILIRGLFSRFLLPILLITGILYRGRGHLRTLYYEHLLEGMEVTAIGYLKTLTEAPVPPLNLELEIKLRLSASGITPESFMEQYDTNKNGILEPAEKEYLLEKLEREIKEEYEAKKNQNTPHRLFGNDRMPLMVFTGNKKTYIKRLTCWAIFNGVFCIACLLGVYFLMNYSFNLPYFSIKFS